jgi:hypothetical protein
MRNHFAAALITAVAVLSGAAPVRAQGGNIDVTAAYQFAHQSTTYGSANYPRGFSVDAAGKLNRLWSWVGQVDFSRKTFEGDVEERIWCFEGGGRWSAATSGSIAPFAQVLVGAGRDSVSFDGFTKAITKFAFDADGGVAVPLTRRKRASAVAEVGYRRIMTEPGLNDIRVVLGLRFRAGK